MHGETGDSQLFRRDDTRDCPRFGCARDHRTPLPRVRREDLSGYNGAMRRRTQVRRMLKWGSTCVCLLMLLAFAMSLTSQVGMIWVAVSSGKRGYQAVGFGLDIGQFAATTESVPEGGLAPGEEPPSGKWWARWYGVRNLMEVLKQKGAWLPDSGQIPGTAYRDVTVPLGPLFLLALIPTAYLWYKDRREPPGHCRTCGYDLTGNVSGVCPECGEGI